ncbi:hypothetical protein Sjap_002477 [Stephania japonica]|uniref:Uncharacterized protein n=1 Tax=Stephania japonica TaxID=461633 RepID=A0AAP0KP46_9MAGN
MSLQSNYERLWSSCKKDLGMNMDGAGLSQEQPPPPPRPPPHDQSMSQIDPVDPPQQGDNVERETLANAVSFMWESKAAAEAGKGNGTNEVVMDNSHDGDGVDLMVVISSYRIRDGYKNSVSKSETESETDNSVSDDSVSISSLNRNGIETDNSSLNRNGIETDNSVSMIPSRFRL